MRKEPWLFPRSFPWHGALIGLSNPSHFFSRTNSWERLHYVILWIISSLGYVSFHSYLGLFPFATRYRRILLHTPLIHIYELEAEPVYIQNVPSECWHRLEVSAAKITSAKISTTSKVASTIIIVEPTTHHAAQE